MSVVIAGGGTGGHLMPALAIADALRSLRPAVDLLLVGAERGIEAAILPNRSFRYVLLPAEPLYRRQWWKNLRWMVRAPRLYAAARAVLERERPAVVVGTGGYAAVPMLLAARARGVPIVLQEQNAMPGLATRWFARAARQVHLGFPEAAARFRPGRQTQVFTFGNPVAPHQRRDRDAARRQLGLPAEPPVVFVFGGSQGSRALNRALAGTLDQRLLDGVAVCWGSGAGEWETCRAYHRPPWIQVRPFWDPIGDVYAACDLVVSRAGAMTSAELCAYGRPAILVPLPTAAADHQTKNAEAMAAAGAARVLPEALLTPGRLADEVRDIVGNRPLAIRMGEAALRRAAPDAARKIAEAVLDLTS
ncbi:MAG TPA: undecaprenyldiphospho-muramoylpentapeptide beta-N-acetylglucosaminyltransferase [Gemmatimonadales bacterium]|nr:undecaprenyldiphospho-muramoylpentapeptide beta-N-acetylglucosaminyltransferase [Gemmatimonadales bacterium]